MRVASPPRRSRLKRAWAAARRGRTLRAASRSAAAAWHTAAATRSCRECLRERRRQQARLATAPSNAQQSARARALAAARSAAAQRSAALGARSAEQRGTRSGHNGDARALYLCCHLQRAPPLRRAWFLAARAAGGVLPARAHARGAHLAAAARRTSAACFRRRRAAAAAAAHAAACGAAPRRAAASVPCRRARVAAPPARPRFGAHAGEQGRRRTPPWLCRSRWTTTRGWTAWTSGALRSFARAGECRVLRAPHVRVF
jgi:hypothetical protein